MQRTEPTRRTLLAGAVVFFAGCASRDDSEGGVNSDENTDAGDDSSESDAGSDAHLDQYESYLQDEEITLNDLGVGETDRVVTIEYDSQYVHEEALAAEMGTIAGGYMQRLEEGWEMDRLEATMYDDGESVATWHMESEWFEEMEADERTPEELSAAMIGTLELLSE